MPMRCRSLSKGLAGTIAAIRASRSSSGIWSMRATDPSSLRSSRETSARSSCLNNRSIRGTCPSR